MPDKNNNPPHQSNEAPHYHGQCERLRERFHSARADALGDYELLEMALFPALPQRDTKPLAKALLKKFGSFAEVIHAPVAPVRGRRHRRGLGQLDQAARRGQPAWRRPDCTQDRHLVAHFEVIEGRRP
jgi:hypothetical protein